MKERFAEFMKCDKKDRVIFGILGGMGYHVGIDPKELRKIMLCILILTLIISTSAFTAMVLGYVALFVVTPSYDEELDIEVNPEAEDRKWF